MSATDDTSEQDREEAGDSRFDVTDDGKLVEREPDEQNFTLEF